MPSTSAVLQKLRELVVAAGVPAANVKVGIPASLTGNVTAFLSIGPQPNAAKTTQTYVRRPRYLIVLGYFVQGQEENAEVRLADFLDAITIALYANRTLDGLVHSLFVETAAADSPEYRVYAGREYRLYPIVVEVSWQEHFGS